MDELPEIAAQEVGTWDTDDVAAAKRYLNEIIYPSDNRRVGKAAKDKALALLKTIEDRDIQQQFNADAMYPDAEEKREARDDARWAAGETLKKAQTKARESTEIEQKQAERNRRELQWQITRLTPLFKEIQAYSDAGDIKSLKRTALEMQDSFEEIELKLKQAKRQAAENPYKQGDPDKEYSDAWRAQEQIKDFEQRFAEKQKEFDYWKRRHETAANY